MGPDSVLALVSAERWRARLAGTTALVFSDSTFKQQGVISHSRGAERPSSESLSLE